MQEPFEFEEGEEPAKRSKPDWRRRAKKFFDNSSFTGVLYMFASKSWPKRIVWAVVVLAAIGGFAAVTITHFTTLVSEPTSTSIRMTSGNIVTFPAVTICSLSLLNITKLRSAGASVSSDMRSLFDAVNVNRDLQTCESVATKIVNDTGLNLNWGELLLRARNDRSALISSCTFVGKDCTNEFTPVNTVAGVCYTFNGPSTQPTRTVRGTGFRKGLRLKLSPDDQLFSELTNDRGFRIVIHNPDELPRPEAEGIAVGLNSTTYIEMRQITSIDSSTFSSGVGCRSGENYKQNLSFPGYSSYSPSLCQSECFYTYLADRCNCSENGTLYTPIKSPYNELRKCEMSDICCEIQAFNEAEDSCDCPPKCKRVIHSTTVSSSTSNDGFVHVNVFYKTLILETRTTTDSYTVWSLISDTGGNTGLFLGLTLLSGVELLVLVVGLIKDCCCGHSKWPKSLIKKNTSKAT